MESGPAPAHPLTEPGRTTVQLLVASSAVLALIQLVAATSVDVYNGERAGWWIAIQGATVAFAAAFAGAAASASGASWRRAQQKSSSTTPGSLGTGIAAASVAAAVFSMLCWASTSLGDATYPMVVAVFVAAMLGGVVGAVRVGGAVLGGLVSTFAATLVNLAGQALIRAFTSGSTDGGTPLGISAVNWGISAIVGSVAGVWWLSRRRQRSWWSHWSIVGLYPVMLVGIGDFAELLAWLMVDDPEKGEALAQAVPGHVTQLVVMAVIGGAAASVAGRALRAHPEWLVRPQPARVPTDADVLSADMSALPDARHDEFAELAERAAQAREIELAREAEELEDEPDHPLTAEEAELVALADRAVQAREAELAREAGHAPRPTPAAAQEQAAREQAARAAQEQAAREQAAQEQAARHEAAQEQAEQAARLEQAQREAQELAQWAAQAERAQQEMQAEQARQAPPPDPEHQADPALAQQELNAQQARDDEEAAQVERAQTARLAALIRAAQASEEQTAQEDPTETARKAERFEQAQRLEQAQQAAQARRANQSQRPHPAEPVPSDAPTQPIPALPTQPADESPTQPLPARPTTPPSDEPSTLRNGNGTMQTNLTALIPTQPRRQD